MKKILFLIHDLGQGGAEKVYGLKEGGVGEDMIYSVCSHGYGICCDIKPEHEMEKVLFAADELTGLIWAAALRLLALRPMWWDSLWRPKMDIRSHGGAIAATVRRQRCWR